MGLQTQLDFSLLLFICWQHVLFNEDLAMLGLVTTSLIPRVCSEHTCFY
jgi:hypothetical protein